MRPISCAPRDGTLIIAMAWENGVCLYATLAHWFVKDGWTPFFLLEDENDGLPEPTHWISLPVLSTEQVEVAA